MKTFVDAQNRVMSLFEKSQWPQRSQRRKTNPALATVLRHGYIKAAEESHGRFLLCGPPVFS
ncbi:MAG: hypothetical protein E6H09_17215 [Bacteroidetes bacterium]|nr:MAG: hypothetical protein E6H09_17215 [Bacteroidota bacterium]